MNKKLNTQTNTKELAPFILLPHNRVYINIHQLQLVIIVQSFYKGLAEFWTLTSRAFEPLPRPFWDRPRPLVRLNVLDQAYVRAGESGVCCPRGPQPEMRSTVQLKYILTNDPSRLELTVWLEVKIHDISKLFCVKFIRD